MEKRIQITDEMRNFFLKESLERFLKYVKIETTSDEISTSIPSNPQEIEFGKMLVEELKEIGLEKVEIDENGYVYAFLRASKGFEKSEPINFIAHVDTSPDASGKDVKPIIHKNYDGGKINFPEDSNLELSPDVSEHLNDYKGMDIVTSSGDTLLGADDKAGIAEIIAACVSFKKYPELTHCPIYVCFTPDEEIGKGVKYINKDKIAKKGYTVDGEEMGKINYRCFDAWRADLEFIGISNHPGSAKDTMVNAVKAASYFISCLPDAESPEHTELYEGFYHLVGLSGNVEKAEGTMIIRDFDIGNNKKRIEYLNKLKEHVEAKFIGLKININVTHTYENMEVYLKDYPELVEIGKQAITDSGLEIVDKAIRGGTDGAMLSAKGIPTPNIFTGGSMYHSRREYIPTIGLQKAVEVIIRIANYLK